MPFDQVNFVLPAVETDSVLRMMVDARAYLTEPSRWCKVTYRRGEARCINGALQDAEREGDNWILTRDYLAQVCGNYTHAFNDSHSTTHADVLALFDRAIAARRDAIASTPA
jgi:hypothetical protein